MSGWLRFPWRLLRRADADAAEEALRTELEPKVVAVVVTVIL